MEEDIQNVIHLIQESPLDETIKAILIRDLNSEGLTDFLREQIKAYCLEGMKKIDSKIDAAKKLLAEKDQENPPV